MTIKTKRVYEPAAATDGLRILVERLWPRGLTKEKAAIDHWWKEIAPSTALRKWYDHDPNKWPEFQKRYWQELAEQRPALQDLLHSTKGQTMTFVFAARDEEHNSAKALLAFLRRGPGRSLMKTKPARGERT